MIVNLLLKEKKINYINYGMTVLSISYIIFICMYTINQWDLGFLPSMIGRLKEGQIIYKDFDYIRPFFNLACWDYLLKFIPSSSEYFILFCRFIVMIQGLIICFIIQKLIFDNIHLSITLFFLICFLHTFPIMPWHTIDGIFFAVISLYFYKKNWFFSAILFLGFSALSKQSFFIFSLGTFFIILKDFCKAPLFHKKDIIICTLFLLILCIFIYQYQIFDNFQLFYQQVFNSSSSSGFYENSIAPYLFKSHLNSILFIGLLLLIYFIKIKRDIIEKIILFGFLFLILYPFFNHGEYIGIYSFFLLLIVLFLKYDFENKFVFLLLFLNWSASISWGYNLPIFLIFILTYKFIEQKGKLLFLWIISLSSFLVYRLKYTYKSENLLSSHYIFTKKIPSVSGLLISDRDHEYLLEAKKIYEDYKNVIFLPSSPLLDVINESYQDRASWEMDVEYPNWKNDISKLNSNIFAVDDEQFKIFKDGFYKSSLTIEITKRKKIIKKTKHFTIYGN